MAVDVAPALAPAPPTPVAYRVAGRHVEAPGVVTLDLDAVDQPIPEPRPGQFDMLYAFGVGEAPISVSGCTSDEGFLRHTVRAAGPVTNALTDLGPGDPVGVRGPYGTAWPLDAAEGHDLVFVGGGIGVAPLRAAIRRVAAERDRFRRVWAIVGARTPEAMLFAGEAREWGLSAVTVLPVVDVATPTWLGDVGVVTKPLPRLAFEPARTVAMTCGPEVMMRAVATTLLDRGVAAANIHVSLERNMHCGYGRCGHCQIGPLLVCVGGPVLPWSHAAPLLEVRQW